MSAIITKKNRIAAADYFQEMINTIPLYTFIGRTSEWDDEEEPPTITDSDKSNWEAFEEIVGLKRIFSANILSVIPRINWTTAVVYDEYSDSVDMINEQNPLTDNFYKFYVLTNEFNVYKCISNNNRAASTTKPSGQATTSFETPDGYIWKYMYSIKAEDAFSFMTVNWMPCYTLHYDDGSSQWDVQSSAVDGSIEHVIVTDGGSGHTSGSLPTVTITGDGTGATASAIVDDDTGEVSSIIITNIGSGYTSATVTVTGGTGAGTTATVVLSPLGGHGKNAREELGATYKMLKVSIEVSDSSVFGDDISYRRAGLISKPLSVDTGTRLIVADVAKYTIGETVTQETSLAAGELVSIDPVINALYLDDVTGSFNQINEVSSQTYNDTAVLNVTNAVHLPLEDNLVDADQFEPYTGDLFCFLNREKIERNSIQVEKLMFILSF